MTENKEIYWRILGYLIGIPLSVIACILLGFVVVGAIWLLPNFFIGLRDWIMNGTYPFVEVIKWSIIWTRISIVSGIVIAAITYIKICSENN